MELNFHKLRESFLFSGLNMSKDFIELQSNPLFYVLSDHKAKSNLHILLIDFQKLMNRFFSTENMEMLKNNKL